MKAILLSLLLQGSTLWHEKLETFAAITCPTRADVERVENIQQTYMLASTLERTRCLFVAFQGRRLGELEDFSIGGTLYSFSIVETEGYTVYVLNIKGDGWVA